MEKLNDYLQTLLSTCSYELHLEPNKNPYLISANGSKDVNNTPLLGTQISMMVFPLIPNNVKHQLPSQPEIEFVHPHNLGKFNFLVKKSPAGFIVTIRPLLSDKPPTQEQIVENILQTSSALSTAERPKSPAKPASSPFESEFKAFNEPSTYLFDSSSLALEQNANISVNSVSSELEYEEPKVSWSGSSNYLQSEIEIVSVNDPDFQTTFSDTSDYEPPGKRSDFESAEYVPPPTSNFDPQQFESGEYVPPASNFNPPHSDFKSGEYVSPTSNVYSPQNAFESGEYVPPTSNVSSPQDEFEFQSQSAAMSETYPQAQNFAMPPQSQNYVAPQQFVSPSEAFSPGISPTVEFVPSEANLPAKARMDALFYKMAEVGASDLHLSVSLPPMIRKDGKMQKLECSETVLTPDSVKELLHSIMPAKNQEEFSRRNDSDFAYEIPELARFRANIFADRKGMGGVFRIIPTKILTAEQLGLSKAIMNLCTLSKGLVVVTGPTGSGKSTTLCAMVDHINKDREDHIITIEDPIEFTHENQKCLVNQREVGNHTDSFKDALRAALREDPDILLVGEMRDLETISIAIETAETGHLVFGTLHTTTAASTVDRIIDQFPADRQQQIRVMLSESLKGVIAQTLLPKKGGGRVAALEILIVTPAISNLIREGKTFQIASSMQTGKNIGMVMLNDALFDLVQKGIVEPRDAYIKAVDKTNFETQLTRGGFKL